MSFRNTLLLAALSLLPLRASSQQGQNLCKPTADQRSSEIARLVPPPCLRFGFPGCRQFDGPFSPATNASGRIFYFYGFDSAAVPTCIQCPNPSYTDSSRRARISGVVVISGVVTPDGKIEQTRVVESLDPTLDRASLEILKNWRFRPTKDPDGNLVPVCIPLEVSFRLR